MIRYRHWNGLMCALEDYNQFLKYNKSFLNRFSVYKNTEEAFKISRNLWISTETIEAFQNFLRLQNCVSG